MNISKMSIIHFPRLSNTAWKQIDCEIINNTPHIFISASLFYFLLEINIKKREVSEEYDHLLFMSNEYSNILDISIYKPISHLYFKLIEITQSIRFNFKDHNPHNFVMFSFAPNMYDAIEPIYNLRKNKNDTYYGFSLQNTDKWILNEHINSAKNINLLDLSTYLNNDQYKNCADLVYCEGGNKDDPEYIRFNDLFLEISQALLVQSPKGSLIVKLHECFYRATSEIIYILSSMYEKTYIIKPCMTDQINSERFLVCNNFLFSNYKEYYHFFEKIVDIIHDNPSVCISSVLSKIQMPVFFRNKMNECNTIIGQQQLEKTYNLLEILEKNSINDFLEDLSSSSSSSSTDSKEEYTHNNYKNRMKNVFMWCDKYNIEYVKPDLELLDKQRPNIFRKSNI